MFKYIEYINKLFVSLKLRNLSPHNKCKFNWYGKTVRNVKVRKTLDWEWMKYGIHLKDVLKIFVHVWIHYLRFWKKLILLFIFFVQTDGQNSKEKKKKKKAAGKEGGEESVVSVRESGLQISSQVDEYEHDTSDEEVRVCPSSRPRQAHPMSVQSTSHNLFNMI